MPEKSSRLFTVICKNCDGTLMTVGRIRAPEIAMLAEHLRTCSPADPLGDASMLGEVMGRVRVAVVEQA